MKRHVQEQHKWDIQLLPSEPFQPDNKPVELMCWADVFFKSHCAEFKKFTAKALGQNRTCQFWCMFVCHFTLRMHPLLPSIISEAENSLP